jgi:hypothetical protein
MTTQEKFDLIADLIEATISKERERCARIADDYAANCKEEIKIVKTSGIAEDMWGEIHGKAIAALIRRGDT